MMQILSIKMGDACQPTRRKNLKGNLILLLTKLWVMV